MDRVSEEYVTFLRPIFASLGQTMYSCLAMMSYCSSRIPRLDLSIELTLIQWVSVAQKLWLPGHGHEDINCSW